MNLRRLINNAVERTRIQGTGVTPTCDICGASRSVRGIPIWTKKGKLAMRVCLRCAREIIRQRKKVK